MKLPIPSFRKKKPEVAYFLTLTLRDEQIGAYILKEINGELHVIGKHEETLHQSIEQLQGKESIEILDRVISEAEKSLPKNIITKKTMFGVKENWVEENKIKRDYLHKLKQVCDELGLQPTGFLVISEAIVHQLQVEEGAPLTAILVEIGKHQMTISYIRAGKIMETKHTVIVESAAKTADAVLKHFITATVLPARIVIFDGQKTESIAQEFISHQWSKSLPFLHMPQITPLPHGFDARAVILGAAEQMGLRVASDMNMLGPMEKIATLPAEQPAEVPETKTPSEEKEETNQTLAQEFEQRLSDRLGDKEETAADEESGDETNQETKVVSSDNFGFVQDQDISTLMPPPQLHSHTDISTEEEKEVSEVHGYHAHERNGDIEEEASEKSGMGAIAPLQLLQTIPGKLQEIFGNIFSSSEGSIPRWLFIIPIILVLLVGAFVWYMFNVKATVQLMVKPKVTEEQASVTFATSSGNDFSNNQVTAQDLSVDLNGNTTVNATGSKDIGTPAKGTVTFYNNSDNSQSISAGTTVTSSNNINFTLDNDVSVASKSGGADASPSTTDGTVTAKDIGQQANLPSGMTFSVNGVDPNTLDAKNSNAFSGGAKKTVTVVSQKDLDTLATNLPQSLQSQAIQQLQSKVTSDSSLLPGVTSTVLTKKVFNHNLNDQTSSVSLTATVTFHGAAYKTQDLQDLSKLLLKDKFTDSSSLANNSIQTTLSNVNAVDDTTTKADLDVKAGLLPDINTQSLLQQITGKTVTQAENFLGTVSQVESSTIQLHPNIPLIPQVLPRFPNHITIQTTSE